MTKTALKLDVDGTFTTIDITEGLKPLQEAVGGMICGISFGHDLYAYGNDEGLYECEYNPYATVLYSYFWGRFVSPLHGAVVFTGGVDDEGYDVSAPADLEARLLSLLS